jgi:hypothetical protein
LAEIPIAKALAHTTYTTSDLSTSLIASDDASMTAPLPRKHGMTNQSKNQIFRLKLLPPDMIRYPPRALTTFFCPAVTEPTCYTIATRDPKWCHAMNEEFDALLKNCMWSLVPSSTSMNVFCSKWLFQIKRKTDGSIEKYKA